MKLRESGMPPRDYWETLLNADQILDAFGFGSATGDVVELGCGYGTFTIPLARRTGATVHTFDIDPAMIEITRNRAAEAGRGNVRAELRDVLATGFGLQDGTCGACLLFNILHGESPVEMLRIAGHTVRPGGTVAVIHWRSDIATPRGPNLKIRPTPAQISAWATQAGGYEPAEAAFLLPPWHFGLRLRRVG